MCALYVHVCLSVYVCKYTHTRTWGQTDTRNEEWGANCDALVIVAPARQEDVVSFPKSMALHAALFSMELNEVRLNPQL